MTDRHDDTPAHDAARDALRRFTLSLGLLRIAATPGAAPEAEDMAYVAQHVASAASKALEALSETPGATDAEDAMASAVGLCSLFKAAAAGSVEIDSGALDGLAIGLALFAAAASRGIPEPSTHLRAA